MTIAPIFEMECIDSVTVVAPLRDVNTFEKSDLDQSVDQVIDSLQSSEAVQLIVDFQRMPYFGTMMLTALLRFWKRIRDLGGRMALCNLSEDSRDVLAVTRLDTVWKIYTSQAEAIAGIGKQT